MIPDATLGNFRQLTPDELTALSFCLIEESISNQHLQYVLNLHRSDITHLLKKLCMEGYLESDNNGRWTTYKIKDSVDTSTEKGATLIKRGATQPDSSKKAILEEKKVATSTKKVATSDLDMEISDIGDKPYQGKNPSWVKSNIHWDWVEFSIPPLYQNQFSIGFCTSPLSLYTALLGTGSALQYWVIFKNHTLLLPHTNSRQPRQKKHKNNSIYSKSEYRIMDTYLLNWWFLDLEIPDSGRTEI